LFLHWDSLRVFDTTRGRDSWISTDGAAKDCEDVKLLQRKPWRRRKDKETLAGHAVLRKGKYPLVI
jgi:hypothetical protein